MKLAILDINTKADVNTIKALTEASLNDLDSYIAMDVKEGYVYYKLNTSGSFQPDDASGPTGWWAKKDDQLKRKYYYLVVNGYDFVGNNATEITGAEATTWIAKLMTASGWKMPPVTLGDGATSGVGLFREIGGGLLWAFDGASDDEWSCNIPLNNDGIDYDGSDIAIDFDYKISGNVSGVKNIQIITEYKFMDAPNNPAADGITNEDTIEVTGEVINTSYKKSVSNLTGALGKKYLMISIKRNGAGPGTDDYTGIIFMTVINFKKV